MPSDVTFERALNRYADYVYRFALLRDPHPQRAARATAAAFSALDWKTVALDEQLEGRLIAALPPLGRIAKLRWLPRKRPGDLPPAFWQLPPLVRIALALRLTRGYKTDAIAAAVLRPVDDVRRWLLDAIAGFAGDDLATLSDACRTCREVRLDETGAARSHLLACEDCREAVARWDRAEQTLADGIGRMTVKAVLPRSIVESLLVRHTQQGDGEAEAPPAWRQPGRLQAAVVVVVVLVVAVLIMPRGRGTGETAQPAPTGRALLELALDQYGATPDGTGVVHQQFSVQIGQGGETIQADVWTDAEQTGRHRMQLTTGKQVREWQVGDGERSLRYIGSSNVWSCVPSDVTGNRRAFGMINRWSLAPAEQEALRASRWRFGPWALGRYYLEAALAADALRSMGVVPEGENRIVTLAAEDPTRDGTLLIRLDAQTGMLREVREVHDNNGQTQSRTAWRLIAEERLTQTEARRAGVFLDYPADRRPREVGRSAPLLDPACPTWQTDFTLSMPRTLGLGDPPIVGFPSTPDGTNRIYLGGRRERGDNLAWTFDPESLVLVYAGQRQRLTLRTDAESGRPTDLLTMPDSSAVRAGNWNIWFRQEDMGWFSGIAEQVGAAADAPDMRVWFYAEGWERDTFVELFAAARPLQLADWWAQRDVIYDPDPLSQPVVDVLVPAMQRLTPRPGTIQHTVVEREMRRNTVLMPLRDPYHAEPDGPITESWVAFDDNSQFVNMRSETRHDDDTIGSILWRDQHTLRTYIPDANIVRHDANPLPIPPTLAGVELIRAVFRREQFDIVEDATTITLETRVPLAETHYSNLVREQREQSAGWFGSPWLADMSDTDLATIIFRTTFDRSTRQVLSSTVSGLGPDGETVLDRTTLRQFEVLNNTPAELWDFTPPADAMTIDVDSSAFLRSWRGPQQVDDLAGVAAVAPAPIYVLPDESIMDYTGNQIASGTPFSDMGYGILQNAVPVGAAVAVYYEYEDQQLTLIQGRSDAFGRILRQTPALWTESRTDKIAIAGSYRPVWIMRAGPEQHWAIFTIDDTLIVAEYHGRWPNLIWSTLNQLERFR